MYVAMNHFHIARGHGAEFEARWRDRNSYLEEVPGFVSFRLLRGDDDEDGSHRYASHSIWADREAFVAWTQSEAFRRAHGQGRMPAGVMLGPPRFQGWEAVDLASSG